MKKSIIWICGLVGALLSLATSLFYFLFLHFIDGLPAFYLFKLPVKILAFIFRWGDIVSGWQAYVSIFIFSPIFYFLIGSLIGYIVWRFKR